MSPQNEIEKNEWKKTKQQRDAKKETERKMCVAREENKIEDENVNSSF